MIATLTFTSRRIARVLFTTVKTLTFGVFSFPNIRFLLPHLCHQHWRSFSGFSRDSIKYQIVLLILSVLHVDSFASSKLLVLSVRKKHSLNGVVAQEICTPSHHVADEVGGKPTIETFPSSFCGSDCMQRSSVTAVPL